MKLKPKLKSCDKLKLADEKVRERYLKCRPKRFGNLHQRMKYLMAILDRERENVSLDLATAIHDLQTEASYHIPKNPPFGKRVLESS